MLFWDYIGIRFPCSVLRPVSIKPETMNATLVLGRAGSLGVMAAAVVGSATADKITHGWFPILGSHLGSPKYQVP